MSECLLCLRVLLTFRADAAVCNFALGNRKSCRRMVRAGHCVQAGIHAIFCFPANRANQMIVRCRVAVVSSGRAGMQNPLNQSFVRQGFQRSVYRRPGNRWDRFANRKVNRVYCWVRLVFHEDFIDFLSLNGNRQPTRFALFVKILVHGFKTRVGGGSWQKKRLLLNLKFSYKFYSNYT